MLGAHLSTAEIVLRVAVAAALGGVLGLERERDGHEAGFRTHLLLAVGAALFGIVSVGAFDSFAAPQADTNFIVDPSRIASYVAVAVGFLGAGTIVKTVGTVKGLTTAASIWATTAIGLAAGLGYWAPALAAFVAALVALVALKPVSRLARRLPGSRGTRVVILMVPGASAASVVSALDTVGDDTRRVQIGEGAPGQTEVRAEFLDAGEARVRAVLAPLAERPEVASLSFGASRH